jgi:hypothetical protein
VCLRREKPPRRKELRKPREQRKARKLPLQLLQRLKVSLTVLYGYRSLTNCYQANATAAAANTTAAAANITAAAGNVTAVGAANLTAVASNTTATTGKKAGKAAKKVCFGLVQISS